MALKLSLCLLSPWFIDYRETQGDDAKGTHFELVQPNLIPFCGTTIPMHKSGDQTELKQTLLLVLPGFFSLDSICTSPRYLGFILQ